MEGLKEILAVRPDVKTVYFNEAGEYLLHAHPAFPNEKSREEALKATSTEEETGEGDGKTKSKKDKN